MSDTTTPPAAPATPKRKYTRTPKVPKVRTVDPAIQALREQHKTAMANLRLERKSGAVLAGIIVKLARLTPDHLKRLVDTINVYPLPPLQS